MNKRFHFLRVVALVLSLLISAINTELVSSVPAVGGIQKKSPSASTAGRLISQDNGPLSNEAIEKVGRVDILMIPIDALYHILNEVEIQSILSALNPKVIIPMHYQIPELESSPDRPKNLGPMAPWLNGKKNVLRLENNERHFTRKTLPRQKQFIVFKHSPHVTKMQQ
ncbi:MAG: MBL fold metallo-hydrolase [bacterium]